MRGKNREVFPEQVEKYGGSLPCRKRNTFGFFMMKHCRNRKSAEWDLCKKLQFLYEKILSGLPRGKDDFLRSEILFFLMVSVLDLKKYLQTDAGSLWMDPFFFRQYREKVCSILPPEIREMDLFPAGSEKGDRIPPEYGRILWKTLERFVPDLIKSDPGCEWLGRIFEESLAWGKNGNKGRSSRKKTGSFYTPLPVAEYMIREGLTACFTAGAAGSVPEKEIRAWIHSTGNPLPVESLKKYRGKLLARLKSIRILDPSCGAGTFLLAAFRELIRLWETLSPAGTEEVLFQRKKFLLENSLYGMDLQFPPLQIVRFCFFLELQSPRPGRELVSFPDRTHFFCVHALLQDPENCKMDSVFDLVIGNPPYIATPSIDPEERLLYKRYYSFARGRFNLFSLFLEKSRFWMKKRAGCSVWLVPDRVLLNTQYRALQDFLMYEMDLFHFVSFDKPLFPSASVDPVILCYWNHPPVQMEQKKVFCKKNVSLSGLVSAEGVVLSPGELCGPSPGKVPGKIRSLAEKIRKHSLLLGDLLQIRDGIIQGAVGDQLFLKHPSGGIPCEKLLFGRNVSRYRIDFEGNYVHYDIPCMKALEKERSSGNAPGLRMRSPGIFRRAKILTRQTADRIIAGLDEKGEYFYANTLHGSVSCSPEYDLYFILGFLNSRLATFLYRSQSMEQGKAFAQIKIALLKRVPVPDMTPRMRKEISFAVKKILALKDFTETPEAETLSRDIDLLIYSFYRLTPEEIRLVEENS